MSIKYSSFRKKIVWQKMKNNIISKSLIGIIALFLIFGLINLGISQNKTQSGSGQEMVLPPTPPPSPQVESANIIIATKSALLQTASASANPKVITKKTTKLSYTIALFGDSLIDTMGENLDYLATSLKEIYPQTEFKLYNYGIGGQNVEQGLGRFNLPFNFKTRNYPSIQEIHPDIIILGSFSYNPFPEHDVSKHNRLLQSLINQARGTSAKVYLLAEIAPLKTGFGEGPGGVNWPPERAALQATHIIEQLDDTVKLAKTENVPLINVYQSSKTEGNYGNRNYVDTHDGIHPSIAGHTFTANIIANTIILP